MAEVSPCEEVLGLVEVPHLTSLCCWCGCFATRLCVSRRVPYLTSFL